MNESSRRVLRLRYPAKCAVCFRGLEPGTRAEWNSRRKVAICLACTAARPRSASRTSVAGGSAGAEAARRRTRQQARLEAERERRPFLGRLRQGLFPEADAGASYAKGAAGEALLAESLQPLVEASTIEVLHDRRIPGSRANIDHLIVAAGGVWVVDAKKYRGPIRKGSRGGWWNSRTVVTVNGRDRGGLVDGVRKQMTVATEGLVATGHADVAVHGALCFVDNGDWGLRLRPFVINEVLVTWPRALRDHLSRPGELDARRRAAVAEALAVALPPAS